MRTKIRVDIELGDGHPYEYEIVNEMASIPDDASFTDALEACVRAASMDIGPWLFRVEGLRSPTDKAPSS